MIKKLSSPQFYLRSSLLFVFGARGSFQTNKIAGMNAD